MRGFISQKEYEKKMQDVAEPFLKQRREDFWLERETGRKIHCVHYRADNARGVVIISHGFTETAEKYKENIYYFLQQNYSVYIPEHCGHGRSYGLLKKNSPVYVDSWERYVCDLLYVAFWVKKREPDLPLYLYGHSMGGGIGAAAAGKKPELFQKVILSSPMIRPLTAGVPWKAAVCIAHIMCCLGKGKNYMPGQHDYEGEESFAQSGALSEERFSYYQKKKAAGPDYQLGGASYGWLKEMAGLYHVLMRKAYRKMHMPVLVFQAERDSYVSNKEQSRFVKRVHKNTDSPIHLILVPGTKHEIYHADDWTVQQYWDTVFRFLQS